MAIDPKFFKYFADINTNDRVKWTRNSYRFPNDSGTGTVVLIWIGLEEMCDIKMDTGETITVCRAIGDTVEQI